MYPLPFSDIIEIHADFSPGEELSFTNSGIIVPGPQDTNLCSKALHTFFKTTNRSANVKLHLHKQIPFGAGLGGGSSNATTVLLAMNTLTGGAIKNDQLADLASQLGSDCPLFIHGKPMMATGKGEILKDTSVNLTGYFLVLLNPGIVIPTPEAFSKISPNSNRAPLDKTLQLPVTEWKGNISNDFEESVFSRHPLIKQLKDSLYYNGAIYASMSGSGSSVYALYNIEPSLSDEIEILVCWKGWL